MFERSGAEGQYWEPLKDEQKPSFEEGEIRIDAVTKFIETVQSSKKILNPEDSKLLQHYLIHFDRLQKDLPDSQEIRTALTLLRNIRTENEKRKQTH